MNGTYGCFNFFNLIATGTKLALSSMARPMNKVVYIGIGVHVFNPSRYVLVKLAASPYSASPLKTMPRVM